MARPKNPVFVEETRNAIKETAHKLMAENGVAGLSLRAIARDLGISAPALYHYYANLDDLITALIVDAFNALADAVEAGRDNAQNEGGSLVDQLMGAMWAYRQWAIDHRSDFQLIYGSPIPKYVAPRELTVPASARTLQVFGLLIHELVTEGILQPPVGYQHVPESIKTHIQNIIEESGLPTTPIVIYIMAYGWVQIHGIVMLELFEHIQPIVGDMNTFTQEHLKNMLRFIGIDIK